MDKPSQVLPPGWSPLTQAGNSNCLPTALAGVLLDEYHLGTVLLVPEFMQKQAHW